jgi:cytochrome c5
VRRPDSNFFRISILIAIFIFIVGMGILATPSRSHAQAEASHRTAALGALSHGLYALPAAGAGSAGRQDAGQAAPPAAATSTPAAVPGGATAAPKPVVLPDGDGKPIATEYCQDCHHLTNLTKAHKNEDDWKDTVQTMIDRGARIPDDKVDTLVKYLVQNFGPQSAAAAANAPAAATLAPSPEAAASAPAAVANSAPASMPAAGSASASAATPAPANLVVVLPEGEGKAIATEDCQACHKLTNLTKAHKSLDDWKDTVQTMIDRGANVPDDKIDILVQYLAKNFGPISASAPATGAPAPGSPSSSVPSSTTQSQ